MASTGMKRADKSSAGGQKSIASFFTAKVKKASDSWERIYSFICWMRLDPHCGSFPEFIISHS